jgi:hypothetical protein
VPLGPAVKVTSIAPESPCAIQSEYVDHTQSRTGQLQARPGPVPLPRLATALRLQPLEPVVSERLDQIWRQRPRDRCGVLQQVHDDVVQALVHDLPPQGGLNP